MLAKSQFFLFSYPEKGAGAAGILMTVIRTAKLSQVDPEKYIAYVLTQLERPVRKTLADFFRGPNAFRKR